MSGYPTWKPGRKVAYLGPVASFSNQATAEYFGPSALLVPIVSFADVFTGIQDSVFDFGVVPVENSSNGSVVQVLDLLADTEGKYADVRVCGEKYLTVHHCLLARKLDGYNSSRLHRIKKLYTHPQAWGQCDTFLSTHFKNTERQDVSSTSRAASLVSQDSTFESAAIASKLAGEEHNLEILAENIEDRNDNTTRFFIIKRRPYREAQVTEREDAAGGTAPAKWKTLISFTIDHGLPGALAEALNVFKTNKLNLTSINSRPGRVKPWQYVFFVEYEWMKNGNQDEAVKHASEELRGVTKSFRDLGSWKDQLG